MHMQLSIYGEPNWYLNHLVKIQLKVIINLVIKIIIFTAQNIQKNLINNDTHKTLLFKKAY